MNVFRPEDGSAVESGAEISWITVMQDTERGADSLRELVV